MKVVIRFPFQANKEAQMAAKLKEKEKVRMKKERKKDRAKLAKQRAREKTVAKKYVGSKGPAELSSLFFFTLLAGVWRLITMRMVDYNGWMMMDGCMRRVLGNASRSAKEPSAQMTNKNNNFDILSSVTAPEKKQL